MGIRLLSVAEASSIYVIHFKSLDPCSIYSQNQDSGDLDSDLLDLIPEVNIILIILFQINFLFVCKLYRCEEYLFSFVIRHLLKAGIE